jgi:hypothetical protein
MGLFTEEISDKGLVADVKTVPVQKLGLISLPLTQRQRYYRLLKQTGQLTSELPILPGELRNIPEVSEEKERKKEKVAARQLEAISALEETIRQNREPTKIDISDISSIPQEAPTQLSKHQIKQIRKEQKKEAKTATKRSRAAKKLQIEDPNQPTMPAYMSEPISGAPDIMKGKGITGQRIVGRGGLFDFFKSIATAVLPGLASSAATALSNKFLKKKTVKDILKDQLEATTDPEERKKLIKDLAKIQLGNE